MSWWDFLLMATKPKPPPLPQAAATATGPLALDAGDGVTPSRQQPHGVANHVSAKCLDGPFHRSVRTTRNCKSGRAALRTAKNNSCPNCVLQSLTMIRKGLWGVQFQVRVSVMGHNRIHDLENIGSAVLSDEREAIGAGPDARFAAGEGAGFRAPRGSEATPR